MDNYLTDETFEINTKIIERELDMQKLNLNYLSNKLELKGINGLNSEEIIFLYNSIDDILNSNNLEMINKNIIEIFINLNLSIQKLNQLEKISEYKNKLFLSYLDNNLKSLKDDIEKINIFLLDNCKEIKYFNLYKNIDNLKKIINLDNNRNIEVAQIYDYYTGNEIDGIDFVKGEPNKVDVSELLLKLKENIFNNQFYDFLLFHNHPNNSYFSEQDIRLFITKKDIKELILLTNNEIYTLEKKNIIMDLDNFIFDEFNKHNFKISYFHFNNILKSFNEIINKDNLIIKSKLNDFIDNYEYSNINLNEFLDILKHYKNIINEYISKNFIKTKIIYKD